MHRRHFLEDVELLPFDIKSKDGNPYVEIDVNRIRKTSDALKLFRDLPLLTTSLSSSLVAVCLAVLFSLHKQNDRETDFSVGAE